MIIKRDTIFLKEVGAKIKAARKAKKLSVRKFAEICRLDYSWTSRTENGQSSIRILTLKRMADALGVDVKDFL